MNEEEDAFFCASSEIDAKMEGSTAE